MKIKRFMACTLISALMVQIAGCATASNSTTANNSASAPTPSAAVSQQSNSASSTPESVNAKIPATFPLVDKPTTISVFTNEDDGVDLSKNWFTGVYEELTGVTVEWRVTNSDQYLEKLNLLLAGGDTVDIITTKNKVLPKVNVLKYGTQGVLLPINSFFDTVESNYEKNVLSQNELWRNSVTAPDGNIYGFSDVGSCFHCSAPYKMWVNQKWLDNLGMVAPTNTEAFYQMLVRFKNEDANGNGDSNDEVPLSTCTIATGSSSNLEGFLMNAFQYTDYVSNTGHSPYIEDKKVVVSYNTEDWREGLRYLNKLYSEGLIDPQAYIQDRATMRNRNDAKTEALFGAVPAQHTGVLTSTTASEKWKEYVAIAPITGPAGLTTTANGALRNYDFYRTMISATSTNPELAFRFCDGLFSSEEIGLQAGFGEEGVAWNWAKDGEFGKDGEQAVYTQLIVGDHFPESSPFWKNYRWGSMFAQYPNNHSKWTSGQSIEDPSDTYYERYLYLNTVAYDKVKRDVNLTMPSFFFSESDNSEIARLQTDLREHVNEATAAFVSGLKNIETDWDAYIKELDNLGLKRYIEIYQGYYDNYLLNK